MRITVFGATGGTGIELVKQSIKRGHEVTAFVRDPSRLPAKDPRVRVARGDVLDLGSVEAALIGAEAAVSALGVPFGRPPGMVRSEGTRNIVSALFTSGTLRFVSVSTVGAGESRKSMTLPARFLFSLIIRGERLAEAERQEHIIRQSDLEWVILRPTRLVNGPGTGKCRLGLDLRIGLKAKLIRADLAGALLDQLETDQFLGKAPIVTN
jgi:putative NADH-flavin reductase